jgi:uncharacterized protein (TIGR00369 family)
MNSAAPLEDRLPAGFAPLPFAEGFIGHNGPLYLHRGKDGPVFGFRVRPSHCNPMGVCHGGWIATMMDMILPLTPRVTEPDLAERFMLTVNLSVDYLGGARLGTWVEGRAQILRRTGRMVFLQGLLEADGEPVARGSGVFRLGPDGAPRLV